MNKPEALRLSAELEAPVGTQSTYSAMHQAAAELRRLHATVQAREDEIETHSAAVYEATRLLSEVRAQRDALLEALKKMRIKYGEYACSVCDQADAAIKAVEGVKT